jgi:glycosyltransferase involved in cell wall biosynthesis
VHEKTVLMIAYHFPPFSLSSGYLRPLKFAQYLPAHGWAAEILTVHPRAYPPERGSLLASVPERIRVHRALALDAERHLSLGGRYPWLLAAPDRWLTWWLPAVIRGLRVIRRRRPQVLFSTYPIPTAHLIGWTLHRLTGIPWIAEFRDPMTDGINHRQRVVRGANRWIEQRALEGSAAAIFVAPSARDDCARRYPHVPRSRLFVIPNGYDEDAFVGLDESARPLPGRDRPLVLVHGGVLYPDERDPRPFFAALRAMKRDGEFSDCSLRVVLRGTGYDAYYTRLRDEYGVADLVRVEPPLPYREALREAVAADGLLLFQGAAVNLQIPAKAYEYLRTRRPIFAVTDPTGDTAALLRAARVGTIARHDSEADIRAKLGAFLDDVRAGRAAVASDTEIGRHGRRARTAELARVLDGVAGDSR